MQFCSSVIKQWTLYILTILIENNVNNKYAFSVYLVLISVTTESMISYTMELGIVRCYINGFINVLLFLLFSTHVELCPILIILRIPSCTVIDSNACLRLSIIVHVSLPMSPPYVSMYHHIPWYMLTFVGHRTCIDIPDASICKHVPSYTAIHAYICWSSSMYRCPCHLHIWACTIVYRNTCLRLLVIAHSSISLMPQYVIMYCRRLQYMPMIVDHNVDKFWFFFLNDKFGTFFTF